MKQFFVDDVGALSCMRLLCVFVDVMVLGVWAWANIWSGQYIPLGADAVCLIAACHGGKALQSRFEIEGEK
jgi:hypothetical protein